MLRKLDEYAKAAIVMVVRGGSLGRADACKRYAVAELELSLWEQAFDEDGIVGLKDRRLNLRRPAWRPPVPMNASRAA
jgi:hypothetical protein